MCLRNLSNKFNEIVFGPADHYKIVSPHEELRKRLQDRWDAELIAAKKLIESEFQTRPSLIPEVQTSLDRWLTFLKNEEITGSTAWAAVDLRTDANRGPYGYLNVIRLDGPDAPGIGIAAWLAEKKWKPTDLQRRIDFFSDIPRQVKTLVLLRHDGEDALNGKSGEIYEKARRSGLDVRIEKYRPIQFESLVAFPRWLQAVKPDVDAAGNIGQATFKTFVEKISEALLNWVDGWRKPRSESPLYDG